MKEFDIKGQRVKVETVSLLERGVAFFHLRAECGTVVRESRLTPGPGEGPGPEHYDEAMLQRDLDLARKKLAEECAWHLRAKQMMDKVS